MNPWIGTKKACCDASFLFPSLRALAHADQAPQVSPLALLDSLHEPDSKLGAEGAEAATGTAAASTSDVLVPKAQEGQVQRVHQRSFVFVACHFDLRQFEQGGDSCACTRFAHSQK